MLLKIKTFKEIHALVPQIVEQFNNKPDILARALVNPLHALEELGYDIAEDVKQKLEQQLRFTRPERQRMKELEREISGHAGKEIDLRSNDEIEKLLFKDLNIPMPVRFSLTIPIDREMFSSIRRTRTSEDPLNALAGAHPVIKPLLEYRALSHAKAEFATREVYNEVKAAKRSLPVSSVKLTFNPKNHRHEEV